MAASSNSNIIVLSGVDGKPITIDDIGHVSTREASLVLSQDPSFVNRIKEGPHVLQEHLGHGARIYGVNTGLGDNCTVNVPKELMIDFPARAITAHGCGMGEYFEPEQVRAIIATRLICFARGYSGVRLDVLQQLQLLLQHDILPRIPREGSVGASGDQIPLSYIGAVLCGQRSVWYAGKVREAGEVLAELGVKPLTLQLKEGLAMINGTSAMAGVSSLCFLRAEQLSRLATRLTSFVVLAVDGNTDHYDKILMSVKRHVGMQRVAARIREDLQLEVQFDSNCNKANGVSNGIANGRGDVVFRLQDRYSTRCAPQIIGVLEDALPFFRSILETELNSTNDNPIIDVETRTIHHGGMFYGGHIAFAMDSLKCQVASLADLMDRQLAILVDPKYSNGLPNNLTGAGVGRSAINHALKGLQIATSAWTAAALKTTMPASVFSRSTECHNQDKVSMGMIAVHDMLRILDLTEQVSAALVIGVRQALELRERKSGHKFRMSPDAQSFFDGLRREIRFVEEDRELEATLRSLCAKSKAREWKIEYNN